ncbi:MAG: hypothetical protein ACRCY9_12315 [Phycicoccus sp.]
MHGIRAGAQVQQRQQPQAEATRAESLRRERLFESAAAMFSSLAQPLLETVEDQAPVAVIDRAAGGGSMMFVAELRETRLVLSRPAPVDQWQGPFDVVASAVVTVNSRRLTQGWAGRSHSLWYCDAQAAGEYAWFEMAFMGSPLLGHGSPVEPFSLTPSEGSVAFSGVMGTTQLAWPVSEIDRDDPGEFVDRWVGWFADAVAEELIRPSTMPERHTSGSWRRN